MFGRKLLMRFIAFIRISDSPGKSAPHISNINLNKFYLRCSTRSLLKFAAHSFVSIDAANLFLPFRCGLLMKVPVRFFFLSTFSISFFFFIVIFGRKRTLYASSQNRYQEGTEKKGNDFQFNYMFPLN